METSNQHIVYFDGVCVLCQNSVKYLLKVDKNNILKFASLQSAFAKENEGLQKLTEGTINTIVYSRKGQLYSRTEAILRLMIDLNHFRWLAKAALLMPAFLRDPLYNLVARLRYSLFGKSEYCDLIEIRKHQDRLIQ